MNVIHAAMQIGNLVLKQQKSEIPHF